MSKRPREESTGRQHREITEVLGFVPYSPPIDWNYDQLGAEIARLRARIASADNFLSAAAGPGRPDHDHYYIVTQFRWAISYCEHRQRLLFHQANPEAPLPGFLRGALQANTDASHRGVTQHTPQAIWQAGHRAGREVASQSTTSRAFTAAASNHTQSDHRARPQGKQTTVDPRQLLISDTSYSLGWTDGHQASFQGPPLEPQWHIDNLNSLSIPAFDITRRPSLLDPNARPFAPSGFLVDVESDVPPPIARNQPLLSHGALAEVSDTLGGSTATSRDAPGDSDQSPRAANTTTPGSQHNRITQTYTSPLLPSSHPPRQHDRGGIPFAGQELIDWPEDAAQSQLGSHRASVDHNESMEDNEHENSVLSGHEQYRNALPSIANPVGMTGQATSTEHGGVVDDNGSDEEYKLGQGEKDADEREDEEALGVGVARDAAGDEDGEDEVTG